MLSAWGNSEFLLYHAFSKATGHEDIIVYYYKNEEDLNGRQVSDLNLYEIPDRPQKMELIYDVYQTSVDNLGRDNYSIYVAAKFSDYEDPTIWSQTLFEHEIDRSGRQKGHIKNKVELDQICVD